ncbi:P-loop containing nucleoside triphosphate hydrolase protein [Mycena latifolia]|nr:P-loop containing nucleoside triphosphate hydrolase protein [Mycena latifolia]
MSASPHNVSSSARQGPGFPLRTFKPPPSAGSDWLPALILNAKAISAGAESLPFPYAKGVFGTTVFLLETVEKRVSFGVLQKVRKNRDDMKELCADAVDIITILRDQISSHRDTAALQFKVQCEELEGFLKDIVQAIHQRQIKPRGLSARLKEVVKSGSTADEIAKFRNRIQEVRANFMLMATVDTSFQVQKVLTVISPNVLVSEIHQPANNCPPPTRIFHGRQNILDKMHQYFIQDMKKQHIFLLHGLGGAGKTQIALKFVEEATSHFTDIFVVDTSTVETIDASLKSIAVMKSVGDSSRDALQWLSGKQDDWLLFFDNADDPKINLNDYFPQCSHGNILITSRNPGLRVYAGAHCAVSDMEEIDAVALLLRSSAADTTYHNKGTAAQIVKTLYYLPLAVVQAGAFIAKSGNLDSYLVLYTHNKARLLTDRPAQAHDNYAWTVYTTWQISFEQLSQRAKIFLQLCSFLHYQGISEDVFKSATNYRLETSGPSKEELEMPLKVLSQFLGSSGVWDPLCFIDVTNELKAYSLINFDSKTNMLSIHPLVHEWTRDVLSDEYGGPNALLFE